MLIIINNKNPNDSPNHTDHTQDLSDLWALVLTLFSGVIVSTPTGSTAYAVAAGASMIHPNVPAIMITPICPHSLSFRPIVVPAGVELKVSTATQSLLFQMNLLSLNICFYRM